MLVWCVLFSVFQISVALWTRNNVCRSFPDYAIVAKSQNCWYNPDINTTPALVAKRFGYPLMKYKIPTEDGFILEVHRIPHNKTDTNSKRQPVLIQHGIGATALFWMLEGENSLPFLLVNNGYDVWLSTARGARYSAQHTRLTTKDPSYWNYSFHEMGIYDLPAIIEFIAKTTNQKGNIIYIGHSMGTTMSYVYSIIKKDHADTHLKALVSLAPVAFMQNVNPLLHILLPVLKAATRLLVKGGIYAIGDLEVFHFVMYKICGFYPTVFYCQVLSSLITGLQPEQIVPELVPVFMRYFPEAISLKTFYHYLQIVASGGRFQHFDYEQRNLEYYNSSKPPIYDVTQISLPVHLFIGRQDAIADEKDADILYQKLIRPIGRTTASRHYLNFSHNDFFVGKDLTKFYVELLDVMKNKIGNK